ncbi:diaminopimelate epimerase [Halostella sp. PRR32]|uniref:diaminopimelate epimerase n=1 Tax=Halostella sp. PRR32 TaxID=3098147 RepID=UPI002B1D694C|nr:diaminopimelate epimerase [Halostella sp. PRR32]
MIRYEKYHGTGNDFVIVDASADVPDWSAFATAYCDRETGVGADDPDRETGADGVLVLDLDAAPTAPEVEMRLYQPDGGTAAMCGNGARCVARWVADRTGAEEVIIHTPAGTRRAEVHGDEVAVEMGVPSFDSADIPLNRDRPLVEEQVEGWEVTALTTGVPHAVIFVDDVSDVDVEAAAPAVRHADVFPEGANVNFAAETASGFDQRTFERGVEGETDACGTGAVAVAAAARRIGLTDDESVSVSPPGGDLTVLIPRKGPAVLRGPVTREFEGELSPTPTQP